MDFFAREFMRFGGMVHLGWQGGGEGVCIGGSVVRRHEVGHDVDGHREDHLEHDVVGPESQKAKTFRIARFLSQKLSG